MCALQGSTKGAINNFFLEQFKLNLENTRFIDFQFHVAQLSPERCFIESAFYLRVPNKCPPSYFR